VSGPILDRLHDAPPWV
jgi:hypothetical protein